MKDVFFHLIFFAWGFGMGWKFKGEANLKRKNYFESIEREAEEQAKKIIKKFEDTEPPKRADRFS